MAEEKCIIDPERDCIGKAAALKLEMRIETLEKWRDSSREFHEKFYEWQRGQIRREATLDEKLSNMEANLEKLVARQEAEDQAPRKRWNDLVDKIVWAVLAAVIAFILSRVGL